MPSLLHRMSRHHRRSSSIRSRSKCIVDRRVDNRMIDVSQVVRALVRLAMLDGAGRDHGGS